MSGCRWLLVGLALALGACPTDPDAPDPLWPSDFQTAWPEVRDCRLSPAAHEGYHIRVFADPASASAYTDGVYPFAAGATLVKGEYNDEACTDLARVSVMQKLAPGAAPDEADWRWQRTDSVGSVLADTPARSCKGCHQACSASDFACTDP